MKASDRAILFGVLILGMAASFWFFLLSPKRDDAAVLGDRIAETQSAIDAKQATVDAARAAQDGYEESYRSLIVLGKAAPEQSDTPTLVTLLQGIASDADVGFTGIKLEDQSTAPAAPASAPQAPAKPPAEGAAAPAPAATPVAATEVATAGLPLGTTVGSAGLPVMPYTVTVGGSYFGIADFFEGVDGLVSEKRGKLVVDGRLFTVDGFSVAPPKNEGSSDGRFLVGTLNFTTYIVPASQGVAAGATPTDPTQAIPAANPTPAPAAPTPAPAASVAP